MKAKLLSRSQSAALDNPLTSYLAWQSPVTDSPFNESQTFMKTKASLVATIIIASLTFRFSLIAQTMPRNTGLSASASPIASPSGAPTTSTTKQNPRPIPFHGMISAVDQKNKTFTISGKQTPGVFKVTDKTVITKGAGAAKFTDIADSQEVSGAYWKNADGSLEAKLIKLGPTEKKNAIPAANSWPAASPSSSPTPSS